MPSLHFVLPHWLYWATLLVFPLAAMYFVWRQKAHGAPEGTSLVLAYMFWLMSGMFGIHRFYLRSSWGFVFVALFGAVLYANVQIGDAREDVSRTRSEFQASHLAVERDETEVRRNPGDDANRKLDQAKAKLDADQTEFAAAQAEHDHWNTVSLSFVLAIAALLLVDAFLIPGLVRRQHAADARLPKSDLNVIEIPDVEGGTGLDPSLGIRTRMTDYIDTLNTKIGYFVAYWAVLSVFGYYYEVIARYVFNSPTNWVHESMFLMYGMQYMLAGAYAYREDAHVRVDVLYVKLGPRGKALCDVITSVFFFIFTGTMLWTAAKFASDSIGFNETSFTEWGIQYWPVKLTMPIGAALMMLQGIAKLVKDLVILRRTVA